MEKFIQKIPNYTEPIFVYYIPVRGLSKSKAEEKISAIIEQYTNVHNMWFCINDDNSATPDGIQCIYTPVGN